MGGAAPVSSARSGRKALDAAINLVPFIDLLSCCISFLLITAVWSQLGVLQPATERGGHEATVEPHERPVSFTLYIDRDGYTLSRSTGETQVLQRAGGDYDYPRLTDTLRGLKTGNPGRADLTIRSDDAVAYQHLVRTMDVALAAGWSELAVRGKDGT
jgi:biopolymer transport protein ExbD